MENNEIKAIDAFVNPIWTTKMPNFAVYKDAFMDACNEIRENNPRGVVFSNENGYQTPQFAGDQRFVPLFERIAEMVRVAIADCEFPPCEIIIDACWANYNESPSAMNIEHTHGGIFSGVFYLHTPPECGELYVRNCFINPVWKGTSMPSGNVRNGNKITKLFEVITPSEGDIYLWASHVPHFVVPNRHNQGRVSISFNVDLIPIEV
jgi:uncharacterized protein (TIGR02466 family)